MRYFTLAIAVVFACLIPFNFAAGHDSEEDQTTPATAAESSADTEGPGGGSRPGRAQCLDDDQLCPGPVHDRTRPGPFLLRPGATQERAKRHDAMHLPDGFNDDYLELVGLFALFWRDRR